MTITRKQLSNIMRHAIKHEFINTNVKITYNNIKETKIISRYLQRIRIPFTSINNTIYLTKEEK